MARVVVVVPCYNEENRLDRGAFLAFTLPGHTLRFRFVDDGSQDGTARLLEEIRAARPESVDVQRLARNSGKAEAVRLGFEAALADQERVDYIGFWDADLAAPLSELTELVALLESHREIDILFGSRVKLMGRSIERLAWRHYFGRVSATLVSMTLSLPIYDTQCGHKLFRHTDMLERVFAKPFLSRWLFDVEILARFITLDPRGRPEVAATIYEYPLKKWVDVRGSKVRGTDFARALSDLWMIKRVYGL